MPEFVDLYHVCSRVAEISLKFESARTDEFGRSQDATEHILAAQNAADDSTRDDHLQSALDAMEDARPEIPEELDDDWQECIDALEEEINDE